jgi:hypothetical protein
MTENQLEQTAWAGSPAARDKTESPLAASRSKQVRVFKRFETHGSQPWPPKSA